LLRRLARSRNLWRRRVAIVSTVALIREGRFGPTLDLAEQLLEDPQDLLHKACGWMLREVGKRDEVTLTGFLERFASRMPRTMLRYAIERFPEARRQSWLKRSRAPRASGASDVGTPGMPETGRRMKRGKGGSGRRVSSGPRSSGPLH
jgi:hypothetical protein